MAHSGKLFALGLLGVAAALVWLPRASPFEVGGEPAMDSEEDDLADTNFVYQSRTLKAAKDKSSETTKCSLLDDPVKKANVKKCSKSCSKLDHSCPDFFVGTAWPPSSYGDSSMPKSCQICQRQKDNKKVYFATLYSTKYRIPEYTATAIQKEPAEKCKRNNNLWKRIQLGLCYSRFHSELKKTCDWQDTHEWGVTDVADCTSDNDILMKQCGDCQALNTDLDGCGKKAHRGHLNPCEINDNDQDFLDATFSMINMAPQAPNFNRGSWKQLEANVTKKAKKIVESATKSNRVLYVITGTKISDEDKWVKGRVLFPSYFWKAVCYEGDTDRAKLEPFGVGVYGRNKDGTKMKDLVVLDLPKFDEWLYGKNTGKHIFHGSVCAKGKIKMWDPLAPPNKEPEMSKYNEL